MYIHTYQIFYTLGTFHGAATVGVLDALSTDLMKGIKAKMNAEEVVSYCVGLDGYVGCMVNAAELVMGDFVQERLTTLDRLQELGREPYDGAVRRVRRSEERCCKWTRKPTSGA